MSHRRNKKADASENLKIYFKHKTRKIPHSLITMDTGARQF